MPLHPQAQAMRDRREREGVQQLYTLSLEQARANDLAEIQAAAGTGEAVASVVDRVIPGPAGDLPIRIYSPVRDEAGSDPLPVLLYFFGGGWTLGTVDTADAVCRKLANAAGCAVVGVGYRLAPENKFPAAVHDCFAGLTWVVSNMDAPAVAVAGDSAGGNLAAAVTLLARDEGVPLVAQVLVYPNTDARSDTASLRESDDPFLFNQTSVAWYWGHYLGTPEDGLNPLASPLRAPSLAGLPPALVITAEHDPLRDQAEQYAQRLGDCGVPVTLSRYDGMPHGFFLMAGDLPDGARAQLEAAEFLKKHLF